MAGETSGFVWKKSEPNPKPCTRNSKLIVDKAFIDLLKKWLSGDFRRTDGERLQSMVAGDDFRREAFEGFSEQSEAVGEREVSAMRVRFEKKYGKEKGGRPVPLTWMVRLDIERQKLLSATQ